MRGMVMSRCGLSAAMAALLLTLALVPLTLQGSTEAQGTTEVGEAAAPGTITVDERSDGFSGQGTGWRSGSGGFDGRHYWTYSAASRTDRVGTWRTTLAGPGRYRILAMIPDRHSTSRAAIYKVRTADGLVSRTVNQSVRRGSWLDLGVHALSTVGEVRLSARTGDPAGSRRMLAFDALRFVPITAPTPAPSPTATPDPTPVPPPPDISSIDVAPEDSRAVVRFSLDAPGPARTEYRVAGAVIWLLGAEETSSDYADHRQVIRGLTPDTAYELRVIATNAGGRTVSDIVRCRTLAPSPPVIRGLRVAPEDTRAIVTFSLDAPGPARSEYRPTGTGAWLLGAEETSSDYADHRQIIRSLTPDTAYELRIVATNAGGRTVSDIVAFTTRPRNVDCSASESLQAAINQARPNDTIIVQGTCTGSFTVIKDLTLKGSGSAVIDAGGGDWALVVGFDGAPVWGVDLTVRDLTIAGGTSSAIWSWGNLLLQDAVVRGSEGAGIFSEAWAVTIQRSTVRNNAGPGYSNGQGNAVTVSDSVFRDNGAAGISMRGGSITISGSAVTGNGGPGISCGGQSDIHVTGTTVARNAGGGLRVSYCPGEITDSTVAGNRTSGDGAGIWTAGWISRGYAPRIERCTIRDNQAAGRGGGIFNAKPSPEYLGPLIVADTTIDGNTAGDSGGGIYSEQEMTLTNVTFSGNTPNRCAGIDCP